MDEDMENYLRYRMMGGRGYLMSKKDTVPHRFECQPGRHVSCTSKTIPRGAAEKRNSIRLLSEVMSNISNDSDSESTCCEVQNEFDESEECIQAEEGAEDFAGAGMLAGVKQEPEEDGTSELLDFEEVDMGSFQCPAVATEDGDHPQQDPISIKSETIKEEKPDIQAGTETIFSSSHAADINYYVQKTERSTPSDESPEVDFLSCTLHQSLETTATINQVASPRPQSQVGQNQVLGNEILEVSGGVQKCLSRVDVCTSSPKEAFTEARYFNCFVRLVRLEELSKAGDTFKEPEKEQDLLKTQYTSLSTLLLHEESFEATENVLRVICAEQKVRRSQTPQKGRRSSLKGTRSSFQNIHIRGNLLKCSECNKTFENKWNIRRHMKSHFDEKFTCRQCNKSFLRSKYLKQHMRTHTGERPFNCPQCEKSFSLAQNLKQHMRTHTGERPFNCPQCEKSFSRAQHLKNHVRTHTGERPFKCQQCDKSFSRAQTLKNHIRTHTGKRPFNCLQCKKSFFLASNLKQHMRTHTVERPFTCLRLECKKSFSCANYLKKHMRTHTGERPFNCQQCDKSFSRADSLKQHMRTHTGERPFNCPQCEKSFLLAQNLKQHISTHTGERPFNCFHCKKSFAAVSTLKKHIMRIHLQRTPV